MRILFLTSQSPYPPIQGGALRSWALLQAAAQRHEVHLLSFGDGITDETEQALGAHCASVSWAQAPRRTAGTRLRQLLLSGKPDMAFRMGSRAFAALLRERVEALRPDIVQAESIELAHYGLLAVAAGGRSTRLVFDDLNAEYALQRSACLLDLRRPSRWPRALYSFVQWRRLVDYEAHVCSAAHLCLVVSEEDRRALCPIAPDAQVEVVPNAIDTTAYASWTGTTIERQGTLLLFTGKLDYRPNIDALEWFCGAVLPLVTARAADAQLLVVGRDAGPPVHRLASPAVRILGFVPDVRPYLASANVYVVPMRMGSGVRFKVLEAWAMGTAVVATPLGAAGLEAVDGRHLLLAGSAREFSSAILALIADSALRARLAADGQELVRTRYDTRVVAPRLLRLYDRLVYADASLAGADRQE